LKPIHRRVWAPIGERPIALSHHRYEWLYVTAFVAPTSGETVWFLSNGIDKPFFAKLLEAFARDTGAGRDRIIVLQLDNAGWHTPENLPVPDGIRLVYQPAYTPELQPAEHLWPLVDEPLANKHFETIDDLDAVVEHLLPVLSEGLSNAVRHSGANEIDISLTARPDRVELRIVDNGCGFENPARISGIANMKHRATALGGQCSIQSTPGHGTRLTWTAPST